MYFIYIFKFLINQFTNFEKFNQFFGAKSNEINYQDFFSEKKNKMAASNKFTLFTKNKGIIFNIRNYLIF